MAGVMEIRDEWRAQIPEWNERWMKLGLSCEPLEMERFADGAERCYRIAGLKWPVPIVRVRSPLVGVFVASLAATILADQKGAAGNTPDFAEGLKAAVKRLASAATSMHHGEPELPPDETFLSAIEEATAQIVGTVMPHKRGSVEDRHLRASVDAIQGLAWHAWLGGRVWASWHAFAAFMLDVCKAKFSEKTTSGAVAYRDASMACGYWWPNPNFVLVSDPPVQINLLDSRLHCETGMALEYPDGWGLWELHGVRVPRWLVTTHERDLQPKKMMEIDNVQVRCEFVRKLGAERIVSALSRGPIDRASYRTANGEEHSYELHRLAVSEGIEWNYLRMVNPSVGLVHFEGVPNDCMTVQGALNFRNGIDPNNVSEDGTSWYQQGDVILTPRGAKKLKPFPDILT